MVNVLLISEDTIKTYSNLDNNVFGKWLMPAILEAQNIQLQNIIGSCLYDMLINLIKDNLIGEEQYAAYKSLLDNQIQDFLIYQTLVNVIPKINVKLANFGAAISNDEHIQLLSQGNIDLLRSYYQGIADVYQKRLQDYLLQNCIYFPELNACNCTGIKPNLKSNTNCSPFFLGGLRCHK